MRRAASMRAPLTRAAHILVLAALSIGVSAIKYNTTLDPWNINKDQGAWCCVLRVACSCTAADHQVQQIR